ncbi:MAG: ABC transporter permease subunit [Thermomicrobiales bacterium]
MDTALLAGAVSVTAALIAVPLAWLTLRADLPGRRVFAAVAILPLVIPSYVGAIAYVAALGPRGDLHGWLQGWFGIETIPSIYGFFGAWLILSLFTYPYVYLNVSAALAGLDPSIEDAARGLGRGPLATFFRITLPMLRPSILAGMLLSALYTVSDFGVVTLLRYDSLTRAIYVQYRASFDRSYAAALSLVLILFHPYAALRRDEVAGIRATSQTRGPVSRAGLAGSHLDGGAIPRWRMCCSCLDYRSRCRCSCWQTGSCAPGAAATTSGNSAQQPGTRLCSASLGRRSRRCWPSRSRCWRFAIAAVSR